MNEHQGEEGFTLIEVLVALTIFSISIAVLLSIISDSLSHIQKNEIEFISASKAQSLMTEMGVSRPLQLGETQGAYGDGYFWRVSAIPYGESEDRDAWITSSLLVTVSVWKEGLRNKPFDLSSLKLAPKETP